MDQHLIQYSIPQWRKHCRKNPKLTGIRSVCKMNTALDSCAPFKTVTIKPKYVHGLSDTAKKAYERQRSHESQTQKTTQISPALKGNRY